jgi:zinc/manganese transport system ATP-binding protein
MGSGLVGMSLNGVIQLQNVTLGYERHPAVHHLCGRFQAGTLTAVMGPNGGGKSTLLKGVVGLLRPLDGSIALQGFDRRDIAYLPQQAEIDIDFPISVLDTVLLGHWRRVGAFRALGPDMRATARQALSAVGLEGFESRPVGWLSAGQRQRVLFARVLVADSPIILLDEPFTAIDARTTADLLQLVLRWHGEGRTIVAALHDLEQVRRHFPETLLLAREAIVWGATADVLTPGNLLKARAMSEAWDDQARFCEGGAA